MGYKKIPESQMKRFDERYIQVPLSFYTYMLSPLRKYKKSPIHNDNPKIQSTQVCIVFLKRNTCHNKENHSLLEI